MLVISDDFQDPCGGLTFSNETVYAIYSAFKHEDGDLEQAEYFLYFIIYKLSLILITLFTSLLADDFSFWTNSLLKSTLLGS
jgi:hypothetical protein